MVSGGMACVKYLLFLFNLIFAITGVVFITVASIILVEYNRYRTFVDNWVVVALVFMIIVGVIVFLVSFFGCCGAVKENHCMIITFSVLLLLIFAVEIGAGISGYMMRTQIGTMLQDSLNSTMPRYKTDIDIQRSWDAMQQDLQCCGIHGSEDWWVSEYTQPSLPASCCAEIAANSQCDSNEIRVSTDGCMDKMKNMIVDLGVILGGVGIGIALVQLIGVIFACCLARSIRREYETVETTAH